MIQIEAIINCKNCLGTGLSMTWFGQQIICSCVTENLEIICREPDYAIKERYTPGHAKFTSINLVVNKK